jgi:hypothetical protein
LRKPTRFALNNSSSSSHQQTPSSKSTLDSRENNAHSNEERESGKPSRESVAQRFKSNDINPIDCNKLWNHISRTTGTSRYEAYTNPWEGPVSSRNIIATNSANESSSSSNINLSAAQRLRLQQDADYAASNTADRARNNAARELENAQVFQLKKTYSIGFEQ